MNEEWKGLSLAELIDLLEPVPEPAPVSMAPQTIGWVWLGLIVFVLVAALVWYLARRWRRNAYRRAALAELAHSAPDTSSLALLVRRTALAAYPRSSVASLFGETWLVFLDKAYGGSGFSNGPGKVLATAPYKGETTDEPLRQLVKEWIEKHRRELPDA
ncbi:DUF4381 domain-containing protein [Roseibium sp.]|uniref:DUF4381 domain-containing protein n=1 Tax=Roseibium sp. TaxID=1936156 RepID=UPI003B51235D